MHTWGYVANADVKNSNRINEKPTTKFLRLAACECDPDLHKYIVDANGIGYADIPKNMEDF